MSPALGRGMARAPATPLPDFRNLGVLWRAIALVEAILYVSVLAREPEWSASLDGLFNANILVIPTLLTVYLSLFLLSPGLARLPYRVGVAAALGVIGLAAYLIGRLFGPLVDETTPADWLTRAFSGTLTGALVLWYFNWRYHVLSPALSEARLIALQARIRPHFLFNSLNTVLGLIRDEPKRAERVLENLADLYRALLSEAGTLVPLSREIELARAYAEIEAMRLGERLKMDWQCQESALDALVPPLILQPLLENAVYHGVEPAESGGEVRVAVFRKGDLIALEMRNPCHSPSRRQAGNRMALDNIRERLALHFDSEAEMSTYKAAGEFVVEIRMPYRRAGDPAYRVGMGV